MVLPAHYESLKDLIEAHNAITLEIFKQDGELLPMIIGYSAKARLLIPVVYGTPHEKDAFFMAVTILFAIHDVNYYTMATEGWVIDTKKYPEENPRLEAENLNVSDSPYRENILMTVAISQTDQKIITYRVLQDRSLEEWHRDVDVTSVGGRMAELLPPKHLTKTDAMKLMRTLKASGLKFTTEEFKHR